MVKLTVTPDAADTLLDTESAKNIPKQHPKRQELENAAETGSDIQTDIPRKTVENIISNTLSINDFSLRELTNIEGMPEFYEYRIGELKRKYKNDEISIVELENKLEPLLTELMKHEDDLIC